MDDGTEQLLVFAEIEVGIMQQLGGPLDGRPLVTFKFSDEIPKIGITIRQAKRMRKALRLALQYVQENTANGSSDEEETG